MTGAADLPLDDQIAQWRHYLARRRAIDGPDVEELEAHLRDQIAALMDAGLAADEALLLAFKRVGNLDAVAREFAREHSDRLWKQLVIGDEEAATTRGALRTEALVVLGLAVAAAVAIKLPILFGIPMEDPNEPFYARNLTLFVLPALTAYFSWKRSMRGPAWLWLAAVYVAGVILANVYPFTRGSDTEVLTILHLPIALWLAAIGVAYAGGHPSAAGTRMNFIRFSGEWFIYYVLIALGGGVLTAFTVLIFEAIDIDAEMFVGQWLVPCGGMGAVLVAAWLVEAKQSVIENMAPVLTRVFTPLFTILLLVFLGTMAWTGSPINIERNVLIAFDLLLVVVVGLVLYAVSARDPQAPPGLFDRLQLLLVVSALAVDAVALAAIAARINEFGFTPNRIAALGENIVLLVNLAWSGWLYARFIRGNASFPALENWQTAYLPVYAAWAAVVVLLFPPLFGYR